MAGPDRAIGSALAGFAERLATFQGCARVRSTARFEISAEWREYCKSGKKPADIPANPIHAYAKPVGPAWGDWLGTGTVAPQLRQYRPFKKARAFVRGLGLKSQTEWCDYCKSGKKPADIPADPAEHMRMLAGLAWGDWLGYWLLSIKDSANIDLSGKPAPSCAASD